ncbi:uncharacterized protein [Antedon mediterranea]|uniref:uncharacterized protein n=2 Tax=Antedon mediterranea TaxID=105859 RepID=UPI003AF8FA6C
MEDAKRHRRRRERSFKTKAEEMKTSVHANHPPELLKDLYEELDESFQNLKIAHEKILDLTEADKEAEEDAWMLPRIDVHSSIRLLFYKHRKDQEEAVQKDSKDGMRQTETHKIELKKMELPKFNGDIKTYTRFKTDFKKFVEKATHPEQLPFRLRSCLGNEVNKVVVQAAEDDYEQMWTLLDEKYGDRHKLVNALIGDILKQNPLKEGEEKQFVEFIDLISACHRNLKRMAIEHEMNNTRVISEIESRLPDDQKRRWVRLIHDPQSKDKIEKDGKLKILLDYLEEEAKSLKYMMTSLHETNQRPKQQRSIVNTVFTEKPTDIAACILHDNAKHQTQDCKGFKAMSMQERIEVIKQKRVCFRCLKHGHQVKTCKLGNCGKDGCSRKHHPLIHFPPKKEPASNTQNTATSQQTSTGTDAPCILMAKSVITKGGTKVNAMFDTASTSSVILADVAEKLKLKGKPLTVSVTKFGGETEQIETFSYTLPLKTKYNGYIKIEVFGMPRITNRLLPQDTEKLADIFKVEKHLIERPTGAVELLIGADNASLFPNILRTEGELALCEGTFGVMVFGKHPVCRSESNATNLTYIEKQVSSQFLDIESMGVACNPKCGSCKCGNCPIGSKRFTLKEERELNLIDEGLSYSDGKWTAKYPWIRDPKDLPDNRLVAEAKLRATEKRLQKNEKYAECYASQIDDMLQRKVARKLSDSEMRSYKGPVHYISHHGIAKPDSKSTPLRIVFNSSANYKGHVLNEYWAKGPDVNNNLLAVLFRFRREQVALVGDIKKMYHSIDISMLDQHTHRFLWRNMEIDRPIHTYCVTAVNFGDGPSATMAIRALQRTAELSAELFPEAAQTLQENVYMDDIADNLQTVEKAYERSEEINAILSKGSFNVKEWTISGVNMDTTKFLGLEWNPRDDKLKVPVPTYCEEIGSLTKRKCLGAANSIYDPLGLLSPVTVRAKILLRNLWGKKVDWDQEIEPGDLDEWRSFLKDVKNCEKVSIPRSVKPSKQSENPTLIMFSDASKEAMGTVAYIRYETNLGVFESRLMAAKSRVAPVRITSIVRLELSAAVMSVRLAKTIREESRIPFVRVLYLVDSEIVRSMIQKESYGFKTFAATRIGEIQQFSDSTDWFWVAGKDNIADIISRKL